MTTGVRAMVKPVAAAAATGRPRWGDSSQRACKIEFSLDYDFSSQTLATLVGPVFEKIAGSLVDAFVKRADQVYGSD